MIGASSMYVVWQIKELLILIWKTRFNFDGEKVFLSKAGRVIKWFPAKESFSSPESF